MGTNDCSSCASSSDVLSDYDCLLNFIYEQSPNTDITVVSLLPRLDSISIDRMITEVNKELEILCNFYGISFVYCNTAFSLDNGKVNRIHLVGDGLHLSSRGTSYLLKTTDRIISLLPNRKPRTKLDRQMSSNPVPSRSRCHNCRESNHRQTSCWHIHPVICRGCNKPGHKLKNCPHQ